jgi:hypothetical protein
VARPGRPGAVGAPGLHPGQVPDAGTRPRTSRESRSAAVQSSQTRDYPAALDRPRPGITLSDVGDQGERAQSRLTVSEQSARACPLGAQNWVIRAWRGSPLTRLSGQSLTYQEMCSVMTPRSRCRTCGFRKPRAPASGAVGRCGSGTMGVCLGG